MDEQISTSAIALEMVGDDAIAVRDPRRVSGPTAPSALPGTVETAGTAGRPATVSHDRETVLHTPHRLLPRGPVHPI